MKHGWKYYGTLLLIASLCGCGAPKERVSYLESIGEPISAEATQAGGLLKSGAGGAEGGSQETGSGSAEGGSQETGAEVAEGDSQETGAGAEKDASQKSGADGAGESKASAKRLINEQGDTLETRVGVPAGYERVSAEEGSFAEFVRQYPMKPAGYKVHLYDGTEKGNQQDHVAVFDLPIEDYDLQQCADSVIRIYAEYFWAKEAYDRIAFHFTSGFLCEYEKWREGYRVSVNGNNVSWIKSKNPDSSYECFVRYLKSIFCYAGTLSMEKESDPTILAKLKAGDVFLYGGSPGHVVMVADVCENSQGKKAFLLAQGYMPAQEFHLLKNPLHAEDPWYYEEEVTYPFHTPEYTFQEGSLRSLKY